MQRFPIPRLRARSAVATEPAPVSAEFAFGGAELPAVAAGLRARLGDRTRPIGSPDQLRIAIEDACRPWAGDGNVEVRRIPAALHTPETWQLRLDAVRPEVRQLVESILVEARHVR